ncbi:DUF1127 domain-containing protein [Aliiroseovarius sp. 2305UL8-7]|uniref:DUF1127 domain-containing protein n=1 Tax=Aliiroseovarius conchicola TaxID=3121637 RepID=UPI003529942A
MATHTTNIRVERRSITATLWSWMTAFGHAMMRASENSSRMRDVQALEARSDAELAKLGLSRADIPRHVFRDMLYI